jgi:polysaccharide pyruvyl transferase WcaK-like protein
LKQVLKRVNSITVRDQASADILRQYGTEAEVVGDAVENNLQSSIFNLQSSNRKVSQSKILLNACAPWKGTWPQADIYLAMTPEDARWVESDFQGEIVFPETVSYTLEIFASAKTAIGQRLHFLILAHGMGANVQTLGEPYAEKVEAWCEGKKISNLQSSLRS